MSLAVQSVVQQMFCGDEVKATVVDLGGHQCRFGFAGQETPRYRFRPDIGIVNSETSADPSSSSSSSRGTASSRGTDVAMDVDSDVPQDERKHIAVKAGRICGDQNLRYLRADLDIRHPFRQGNDRTYSPAPPLNEGGSNAYPHNPLDAIETHTDWDVVETLLTYGTVDLMRTDTREYPLLFAENNFSTPRDKVCTLCAARCAMLCDVCCV